VIIHHVYGLLRLGSTYVTKPSARARLAVHTRPLRLTDRALCGGLLGCRRRSAHCCRERESFMRMHWVAVPEAVRARRVNNTCGVRRLVMSARPCGRQDHSSAGRALHPQAQAPGHADGRLMGTGAGAGGDHDMNWLRFPYVSILLRSHDLPRRTRNCSSGFCRAPTAPPCHRVGAAPAY
jgi:hypothetical protein